MKVKVILLRRRLLSLGGCLLAALGIFSMVNFPTAVGVSAVTRQLPIYCVQRDQKLVSISFDAAWGNAILRTLSPKGFGAQRPHFSWNQYSTAQISCKGREFLRNNGQGNQATEPVSILKYAMPAGIDRGGIAVAGHLGNIGAIAAVDMSVDKVFRAIPLQQVREAGEAPVGQ